VGSDAKRDAVPDHRTHRGAHPEDAKLFGPDALPPLRAATAELSWLLTRGYATPSAVALVGDRHALNARQRVAVRRCACADAALQGRSARQAGAARVRGAVMLIDGYNVLTTVEAALGGGVVLVGRDGCFRDMASMHGTYRSVEETRPALALIADRLAALGVACARWYVDAPVSNSGRLRGTLLEAGRERGQDWEVHLVPDPDAILPALAASDAAAVVATADSAILDAEVPWFSLAAEVVRHVPSAWVVDLSQPAAEGAS
jgi:hypothetical protein